MCLEWSLYTLYLLACQVELPQAIQVFVVVSLVCQVLLFPFVDFTIPRTNTANLVFITECQPSFYNRVPASQSDIHR